MLTSSSIFPNACHSSNMFIKYLGVGLHECFIFYMYWGLTQYVKVPKLVSKLLSKLGNSTQWYKYSSVQVNDLQGVTICHLGICGTIFHCPRHSCVLKMCCNEWI